MSLDAVNTRIGADTFHMETVPGLVIDQEGSALVAVQIGGKSYADLAKGVAGEKFLGFSTGRGSGTVGNAPLAFNQTLNGNGVDPIIINLPVGVTLANIHLTVDGETQAVVDTGAPDENAPVLSGTTLTFAADQNGKKLKGLVSYPRFRATFDVAVRQVNPHGVVAIIGTGHVYTDMYDAAATYETANDGAAPLPLYTGPNGTVTTATGGTLLTQVQLLRSPLEGGGFLGVRAGTNS